MCLLRNPLLPKNPQLPKNPPLRKKRARKNPLPRKRPVRSLLLMILVFVCTGIINRFGGTDEEGAVIV